MVSKIIGTLPYLTFGIFNQYSKIKHFVTTRHGGDSLAPHNSLNLSFIVGDKYENVIRNRQNITDSLEIPFKTMTFTQQTHSANIITVDSTNAGSGSTSYSEAFDNADGLITTQSGICLTVLSADCVLLLFYDPVKQVIAAVHSGWRGTVKKIATTAVHKMHNDFGCQLQDIKIGISPSIGQCCYEVGEDVVHEVYRAFGTTEKYLIYKRGRQKPHFDLWYANRQQLLDTGITEQNIETAEICTHCNNSTFFSARHPEAQHGRFGAGIILIN